MKNYNFLGYSKNEKFCIKGIDVFKYNWIMLGQAVVVIDPETGQPRNFSAYKIKINENKEILFVAGKPSSDNRWLFFDYI
ncbi:MAG: hypothetical protein U0M12_03755 [Acutalibacteraceae bacterium]|nr:hypothetical protein [Acutalibacteraceae bacterium]